MQFVDQPYPEILLNGRNTAANSYILVLRSLVREFQRGVDSISDEVKRCPALHLKRLAWMVRQYKGWHMIRRFLTPPSFSRIVPPPPAHRPQHVSSQNPRAHAFHSSPRPFVLNTRCTNFLSLHFLSDACGVKP